MNELFEYRRELDALRFTPEQKTALAERAARTAEQPPRRAHPPIRRAALVAAALAVVLTVGAGASGALKSAVDAFAGIFGGDVAQTEIIDKIGRPIGASATDNGVTITADAILGDAYNVCIVYTVSRDDGTALLPDGVPAELLWPGGFGGASLDVQGGTYGSAGFVNGDSGDGSVQYLETISSDTPLIHGAATAEFENLTWHNSETGEETMVAEGHWKFRFVLDYEDSSVTLDGGTFTQEGMTFTIDEITVSPVAIRVAYNVDSVAVWSGAPSGKTSDEDRETARRYLDVDLLLTKTDGTVIDLAGSGGSISPRDENTACTKGRVFDEIISLDEIASVSVGGVEFPLTAE